MIYRWLGIRDNGGDGGVDVDAHLWLHLAALWIEVKNFVLTDRRSKESKMQILLTSILDLAAYLRVPHGSDALMLNDQTIYKTSLSNVNQNHLLAVG